MPTTIMARKDHSVVASQPGPDMPKLPSIQLTTPNVGSKSHFHENAAPTIDVTTGMKYTVRKKSSSRKELFLQKERQNKGNSDCSWHYDASPPDSISKRRPKQRIPKHSIVIAQPYECLVSQHLPVEQS
jgi:hypothetical protein